MPEEKARVGFSLDFKDSKTQIDELVKALQKAKAGFNETGDQGTQSLNRINLGMKTVFQNIASMSNSLKRGLVSGQKLSREELTKTLEQARSLEDRILKIHAKTVQRYTQAEGEKRKAVKSTMTAQEQALNQLRQITKMTESSLEKQRAGYGALASILSVKLSGVLRDLVKDSALLAAKNQVLATAMYTVGNNAGISNAELDRTEKTVKKFGISINDTRELISRFAQANLGMANATKLARAAQDLAAGSTLGSSEALRIMTQSILSLLPRQLRQFGVVVNLNQVYQEQSRILGKSVQDLTSLEKRQGLLNKIFEEAAKRAGAYEKSMEDSGKVLTSLSSRVIPDTLSALGEQFLPILEKVVFGFYNLLQWVQAQEGAFKTFIAILLASVAAVTTVVGAFTALSGIVGAATGGFTGFSAAAASTLAGMGPLAAGIAAVTAGLILMSKFLGESSTAQERALESSKGLLDIELDRKDELEGLRGTLENQALQEEDLRKIIEGQISSHKEFIPLLQKEKVTREDLLKILDEEIIKNKEALSIAKERTKLAAEEQLNILQQQQDKTNKLVIVLDKLQKKYGEGKVPVLVLAAALRVFQDRVEENGGTIDNVADQMRDFADENDGGMQNLIRASQKLGERIKTLRQDIETEFGTATKKTEQSASDMQQALLGLDEQYGKLVKKASKKFPFKALEKEEVDAIKRITDAYESGLITQEQADEKRFKVQEVFQERRRAAELKFQTELDSLGKSRLEAIEANRRKELEINEGSQVALEAIDRKAALARNAVYAEMWGSRLDTIKDSTDAIVSVINSKRDLDIASLRRNADIAIAQDKLSTSSRISIIQDFYNQALLRLSTAQSEELSVRGEYFKAVETKLKESFDKGVITEEQFNEQSKALVTDLKNFRQQQISERISFLKNALSEMYSAEANLSNRIKQLDQDKLVAQRSTEAAIREIRQQGLSEYKVFLEERKRADELLQEAQLELQKGNYDRVKEINNEIKSIAKATSQEVRASGAKDAEVLITADQARIGSIKLVEQAGALLQSSFTAQRAAEESALSKVKDKIDEIKVSLNALLSEKKQIEVEVIGGAEKQIKTIKNELETLKDKTVTITVVTRKVTAGGEIAGAPTGASPSTPAPAGTIPALAQGAVDIQGPGTPVSDSIVAFLSRGESVINAAATRMFKPILELMNSDPMALSNILVPKLAGAGNVPGGVSESTAFGDINITINGVSADNVRDIDWKRAVRDQIAPELNRLSKRRASI